MSKSTIHGLNGPACNSVRRDFLRSGLAAGALFLPVPWCEVWAQSEGTIKVMRLPKTALVIGNSNYTVAPLRNPANDARAIAAALRQTGFQVMAKLDAGQEEMSAAIAAYIEAIKARDCVGLFYFAGHGLQLAWRNYMLPVDARIDVVSDVPKRAVDLTNLLGGISKAGNALNVIVLDACRDNPFGTLKGVDQKGLSQMDAPRNTLLAYATSPGNVASDGEGVNSLYTEHLLREMKVPEAKLEDVFKRVRLGVRRGSNGQQIPWESTSLEEDFWFIPPKQIIRANEQAGQAFDEALALWERVKTSGDIAALEEFLRRYPSSEFSELAQLRLDTLLAAKGEKRIQTASQTGNPFTQGYARADTNFKAGDYYAYRVMDIDTRAEKRVLAGRITDVTDTEVIIGGGNLILDRMGNTVKTPEGVRYTDNQNAPLEFYVGKKWTTQYRTMRPDVRDGQAQMTEMDYKIVGKETVTVPAGTFDCFRVDGRGVTKGTRGDIALQHRYWYAPEKVRRFVVHEFIRRPPQKSTLPPVSERQELTGFRQT